MKLHPLTAAAILFACLATPGFAFQRPKPAPAPAPQPASPAAQREQEAKEQQAKEQRAKEQRAKEQRRIEQEKEAERVKRARAEASEAARVKAARGEASEAGRVKNAREDASEAERVKRAREEAANAGTEGTPAAQRAEMRETARKMFDIEELHRDRLARMNRLAAIYRESGDAEKLAEIEKLQQRENKRYLLIMGQFKQKLGPAYAQFEPRLLAGQTEKRREEQPAEKAPAPAVRREPKPSEKGETKGGGQ